MRELKFAFVRARMQQARNGAAHGAKSHECELARCVLRFGRLFESLNAGCHYATPASTAALSATGNTARPCSDADFRDCLRSKKCWCKCLTAEMPSRSSTTKLMLISDAPCEIMCRF